MKQKKNVLYEDEILVFVMEWTLVGWTEILPEKELFFFHRLAIQSEPEISSGCQFKLTKVMETMTKHCFCIEFYAVVNSSSLALALPLSLSFSLVENF